MDVDDAEANYSNINNVYIKQRKTTVCAVYYYYYYYTYTSFLEDQEESSSRELLKKRERAKLNVSFLRWAEIRLRQQDRVPAAQSCIINAAVPIDFFLIIQLTSDSIHSTNL